MQGRVTVGLRDLHPLQIGSQATGRTLEAA